MKKTGRRVTSVVLSVLMILSMLAVGMMSSTAASTITLYYCPKQAWLDAGYTVRANACVSNGENKWIQAELAGTKDTVDGNPVYAAVFDTADIPYGGFDKLQLQAYEGSTWKEQVVPNSSWVTTGAINGKFYDGSAWVDYAPDTEGPTVTTPTEAPTTAPTDAPTQAAAPTTLYFSPNQEWIDAGYMIKANACGSQGDNLWTQLTMTKTDSTFGGKAVYTVSVEASSTPYGGFDKLQFQAYEGDTWKAEIVAIDSWMTVDAADGKLYDGENWVDYVPGGTDPTEAPTAAPTESPTTAPTEAPTQGAPITVYFCPSKDWTDAGYTIKANICGSQYDNVWTQVTMVKTDETVNGNVVYTVLIETSATPYGGFDKLQFQAYDGDTWKAQVVAADRWMTVGAADGKLYDGENWVDYVPGGTDPTEAPTTTPTEAPTTAPTQAPTEAPTQAPTTAPTEAPTTAPTEAPTTAPTEAPTTAPTEAPTTAPTEAPTTAPTEQPTNPSVEKYMLGDVNGDDEITLADVLAMQNYLAARVLLTDRQILIGDVDRNGKIDLVDILEMQKYLALMPTDCEIGKYFGDTQEPSNPESQTVTLYFSNGVFWDEAYAYAWRASDENKNQEWPGRQLVSLGKNDLGEDIYSVTLDISEYDNIIFSNGDGQQTQDIALSEVEDGVGIYCNKSSQDDLGHYAYGTYQFDPSIIV